LAVSVPCLSSQQVKRGQHDAVSLYAGLHDAQKTDIEFIDSKHSDSQNNDTQSSNTRNGDAQNNRIRIMKLRIMILIMAKLSKTKHITVRKMTSSK
jgi:hypothetical protein